MKVVRSVFVLLATRGHDILYNVTGGRRYSIDLYIALTLTFVYCAQQRTCYYRTVINIREFNFRRSRALRKYFNNEIFPNYGRILLLASGKV